MANINVLAVGPNYVTARIENLDLAYWNNYGTSNLPRHTAYSIYISGPNIGGGFPVGGYVGKGSASGTSSSTSFSGLSPSTIYTLEAYVDYLTSTGDTFISSLSVQFGTSVPPDPPPTKFHWYNNAALSLVDRGGFYRFPNTEWGRLIDKIEAIQSYRGQGENLLALRRANGAKFNDGDLYNTVVNKLKSINSGVSLTNVTKGIDYCTPARIEALRTAVNYIIDHL